MTLLSLRLSGVCFLLILALSACWLGERRIYYADWTVTDAAYTVDGSGAGVVWVDIEGRYAAKDSWFHGDSDFEERITPDFAAILLINGVSLRALRPNVDFLRDEWDFTFRFSPALDEPFDRGTTVSGDTRANLYVSQSFDEGTIISFTDDHVALVPFQYLDEPIPQKTARITEASYVVGDTDSLSLQIDGLTEYRSFFFNFAGNRMESGEIPVVEYVYINDVLVRDIPLTDQETTARVNAESISVRIPDSPILAFVDDLHIRSEALTFYVFRSFPCDQCSRPVTEVVLEPFETIYRW